jgi:hypothetical protein
MNIVYSAYYTPTEDPEVLRRLEVAQRSIAIQDEGSKWIKADIVLSRDAISIGDGPLPFVRDLISECIKQSKPDDVIVLVNADICFCLGSYQKITEACLNHGAAFSHRWDFVRLDHPLLTEDEVGFGQWYCGSDFFCFTQKWWDENNHHIPDMVLGREAWDMVFRRTIKQSGGAEIHRMNHHEWHPSPWELNRDGLAGNIHNRNLASEWLAAHGGDYYDWK